MAQAERIDWFHDSTPEGCRFYQEDEHYILYLDPDNDCVWNIRRALCLMGLKMRSMGDSYLVVEPDEAQMVSLSEFFGRSL